MNRKSKIIVSVVGITIVLLALLGITYAYYLTRIEGNTNTNSISVTTADLKLVYGDGTGPNAGLIVAEDIMPGTDIIKEFTVSNKGKSKVEGYLVVLENVTNTLTRKEDLVYTLDCKLQDGTSCGSVTETIYPTNTLSVIYSNDIDINVTHNYTLTVHYKNLENVDQSEDMGSEIEGQVNIMDGNTNPYKTGVTQTDNNSLVYNIINNAMKGEIGTIYSPTPLTSPLQNISRANEKTLSVTQDNYGTSYYFRGNVEDNYVLFNNMCFRIVRIEGDGSIKLIYAGSSSCSNAGSNTGVLYDENEDVIYARYGNEMNGNTVADYLNYKYSLEWEEENGYYNESRGLREQLELWYNANLKSYESFLKNDLWCLEGNRDYTYDWDGKLIEYGNGDDYDWNYGDYDEEDGYGSILFTSGKRLLLDNKTSLKCDNEKTFESFYGTLLADEVVLAGGNFEEENNNYYLYKNAQTETYSTFSVIRADFGEGDNLAFVSRGALNEDGFVYSGYAIRPSITLLSSAKIINGGNGTKTNPYVIDLNAS